MITAAEFLKWLNVFNIHSGGGGSVMPANIQDQSFTYAVDSGIANAYVIALSPAPAALIDGLALYFKASHPNTAASTINVNGLGVTPIVTNGNHALVGGEILLNGQYDLIYNSSYGAFVIVDTSLDPSDVTPLQIQQQAFTYSPDIGSANAVVLTLTPMLGAYYDGMFVSFAANSSNTGATTISIDGLGAVPIKLNGNIALTGGEILSGRTHQLIYSINYSAFILLNPSVIAGYLTTTLASGNIFVGNGSNIATPVAMSGDATLNNAGILTLANTGVTAATYVVNGSNLFTVDSKGRLTGASNIIIGAAPTGSAGGDLGGSYPNPSVLTTSGAAIATRPGVQNQSYTSAVATGTANAIILALTPAIAGYNDLAYVCFKASSNNTGATTININGVGAIPIVTNGNHALVGGEILANGDYILIANNTYAAFVLINSSLSSGGGVTAAQVQNQSFDYAVDSGATNAYAATLSPAPSSYVDGLFVILTPTNSNTGASTLNVNGLGTRNIITNDNNLLSGGEMLAGLNYYLLFQGGTFQLLNQSGGVVAKQIQKQSFTYAVDTGSGSGGQYVVTLSPAPSSYIDGMYVAFKAANTFGLGLSAINVNGLGFVPIFRNDGTNIRSQDIVANGDYILVYNSTLSRFVLTNPTYYPVFSGATAAQIQQQAFTYAVDSGAANAYVVTLNPAPGSLTDGLYVSFKATNANTGATTINVNSLGVTSIVTNANAALTGGEILANGDYLLQYNSTFAAFVIINSSLSGGGGGITAAQVQQQAFTYAIDSGSANAYVVTLSPAPGSYTDGMIVAFKAANTNTANSNINVNGLGAITIISPNTLAILSGGEIQATCDYLLMYSSSLTEFILINPSIARSIQNQKFIFAISVSAANTYTITLVPAPITYTTGMMISFSILNNNTGASTINVNSLGAKSIFTSNGLSLRGGELTSGKTYLAVYNSTLNGFILINSSNTPTPSNIQSQSFIFANSAGTSNALTLTVTPAILAYSSGQYFSFKAASTNTGSTTININGQGAQNILLPDGSALTGGEIIAGNSYGIFCLGTNFTLLNSGNSATKTAVQKQSYTYAIDSGAGGANAYTITLTPAPTAYTDGMFVCFQSVGSNTGAATINVNGLGAIPIHLNDNSALVGGEILNNGQYILTYNAAFSAFVISNPTNIVTAVSIQSSVVPSGSAITLSTSNSPANVTTLTLTKNGTYLVWGNIGFTPQSGGVADFYSWVSSTSATLPDLSLYNKISTTAVITNPVGIQTPQIVVVVSSAPQTVYLSAQATFGIGVSCTACGGLYAELL